MPTAAPPKGRDVRAARWFVKWAAHVASEYLQGVYLVALYQRPRALETVVLNSLSIY